MAIWPLVGRRPSAPLLAPSVLGPCSSSDSISVARSRPSRLTTHRCGPYRPGPSATEIGLPCRSGPCGPPGRNSGTDGRLGPAAGWGSARHAPVARAHTHTNPRTLVPSHEPVLPASAPARRQRAPRPRLRARRIPAAVFPRGLPPVPRAHAQARHARPLPPPTPPLAPRAREGKQPNRGVFELNRGRIGFLESQSRCSKIASRLGRRLPLQSRV